MKFSLDSRLFLKICLKSNFSMLSYMLELKYFLSWASFPTFIRWQHVSPTFIANSEDIKWNFFSQMFATRKKRDPRKEITFLFHIENEMKRKQRNKKIILRGLSWTRLSYCQKLPVCDTLFANLINNSSIDSSFYSIQGDNLSWIEIN